MPKHRSHGKQQPASNRECRFDERLLFELVEAEAADGGAGAFAAAGVAHGETRKQFTQLPHDETPRSHVSRFFLAPDQFGGVWETIDRLLKRGLVQRIKLLDANECRARQLILVAEFQKVVI